MLQPWFLVVTFVGAFYGLLIVALVRRAMRPSCRTCSLWQQCLEQQVSLPGIARKICR